MILLLKNDISELFNLNYNKMNSEKSKKIAGITQNLNKILGKSLQAFVLNTSWTDINNWLINVQSLLHDYPSPFIADKILLSKRLNQCMNRILPQSIHQCVLRIHQILFNNMKLSVQGNINDYIKLFAEDLGVYSVSILPHFVHTNNFQHRLLIIKIINNYYLDLGKQLIPLLAGLLKSLLSVYTSTINNKLINLIDYTLNKIFEVVGRRYFIGVIWSLILKYKDCKQAGIKFLSTIIDKMQHIQGEQDFDESRGFSAIQRQLQLQGQFPQQNPKDPNMINISRKSITNVIQHLNEQQNQSNNHSFQIKSQNSISNEEIQNSELNSNEQSPISKLINKNPVIKSSNGSPNVPIFDQTLQQDTLCKIVEEPIEQSVKIIIDTKKKEDNPLLNSSEQLSRMFESQAPFGNQINLKDQNEIKLTSVPLMVSQGISMIKEGIDENTVDNNYPNFNTLVINSLISCLQEDEPLIKRSALDFMFSHLRIKSQLFRDQDRQLMVETLLRLFKKKQISITKRVNKWIFGKEDEENRYVINQKNQFVIPLIINGFQKILATIPTSQQNCTYPLKILQNFYIEHPQLVNITLNKISMNILRYIFNFGHKIQGNYKETDFSDQVKKVGKRFLQNLPSYYTIIFRSLGQEFIKAVQQQKQQTAFQAIKYIDFAYITLMKHEHGYDQLQYITIILQFLANGLAIISSKCQKDRENKSLYRSYLKDTILLIYNLIDRRKDVDKINKRQQQNINFKFFEETGYDQLPPERIKYQEDLKMRELFQQQKYIEINDKMEQFFLILGHVVRTTAHIQQFQESFKICSMCIVKLQINLPRQASKTLPKWFHTLEGAIKISNPLVSLSAIQSIIKCLTWQNKHPIYTAFKNMILQEKVNKIGTDYQKLALEKLWSLLDYPHMHSKIIDLIVSFSKYFPFQFTQTVKRSFNTHSAPDKQASIQRFSHFWRLTGFKYKDLLTVHKQFVQLNKVGLFRMLDFLDDTNPLVRHAAKNWLIQSMTLLTRVIEPLLQELIIGCSEWYQTPKGIFLIQKVYDTSMIFSTFRRIRSILSNGSYSFLRFVYQTQISDSLDQQRQKITSLSSRLLTIQDNENSSNQIIQSFEREPVLPKALQNHQKIATNKSRMSYLDLLIILTVKYIEGHAIESMGMQFYVGNSGVNTSAVQLIQTLLDYIDNPILCQKLVNYIIQYLFKILNQVVLNKQYIMQIQLINLIKNIFFNSSFRKKAEISKVRLFFKKVFTNKVFIVSLLEGLHTPFAYVRSQFILFITVCIPLIADFLDPTQCTQCIRHILYTYYKIIKDIGKSFAKVVVDDIEDTLQVSSNQQREMTISKIYQLQLKIKIEQKFVKFADNLNQVSKTNQILSVLHGVQAILNYFYDLNKLNIKDINFQFTNPYTIFDTFKKIITFGFANSQKNAKIIEKKNFLHNYETCEALLKDLEPVYQTILRSWPLSQQFVRIGSQQFSSVGMRSFNFQNFSRYNKVVRQLIDYVQQQKESIWGKIYCIMQPMFWKFPKQIINIYMKLWIRQCSDVKENNNKIVSEADKTQFLMKIMETIIVNNFPMNIVIHAFLQSQVMQQLINYYLSKNKNKKGKVLNFAMDKYQSKLLYFLYVYFNYVYLNQKQLTYEPLLQIWSYVIKVLKPFRQSNSPLSAIWIIQIINLCSRKYSPKELLKNQRFKQDLHSLTNQKLKYIAAIASRKQIFFFSQPLQKIKFDEDTKNDHYHMVAPLPPTLYDIQKSKKQQRNFTDNLVLKQHRPGQNNEIETKYRIYCFKILKKLGLQILQNTYLPQKTHWVVIRAVEWIDLILPVIEDKASYNMIYAECASQIIFDILERARILFIKDLKPKVLHIFNKDDFFICNVNTLNYWAKIIDWIVSMDKNNQTYLQYLDKVNLSSSYFTSQSIENKKRIKSFQRICFILYSGQKDKYASKLAVLLQKIADVIKKPENSHAALLILVLFAIRILILKLSELSLKQVFTDIWPMILTLLMQTFSKQLVRVHIVNQISKNPNYLLAALKLIEMISLTNLGEFSYHQWIFICDYFGVDISVPEISAQMLEHFRKRPQLTRIIATQNKNQTTPFIYRPFLLNYLPQSSVNYIPEKKEEQIMSYKANKRLIIVKDSFIRDENQLKMNTILLMQYMIQLNQYRIFVDWSEVQQVIVNDFIKLDEFIHKIN